MLNANKSITLKLFFTSYSGLHKLFHAAIPDGRTGSKLGEHGEHRERREHGKKAKYQPDKHFIYDSKHFFYSELKTLFCNQMTQNTLSYGLYVDGRRNHNTRARRTRSRVSSKWENIKQNVEPCSYYFFHGSASHFIFSKLKRSSYDSVLCTTFS